MRIIAGPCQHETYEQSLEIATECKRVCDMFGFEYIFKASYDKANRTHISGQRGRGMANTLEEFKQIKEQIDGLKILTDVHSEKEVFSIADWWKDTVDVVQIPAFLCRQTDIIRAACSEEFIVNIKKGQFLAPWDVEGILSKTEGAKEVWITERGTSFGYNNLVVDFTGIDWMLSNYDVPIIFDATHSVQKPGGLGKSSGGNRSHVAGLCRAASALGVSNFFIEVHADPDNAPSDGPNMVKLEDFESVLYDIYTVHYDRKGVL